MILVLQIFSAFLARVKILTNICSVVRSSHQSAAALPDSTFDTRPNGAFGSLYGSYVVPMQPGVGDFVLRLWVLSRTVFGTPHHYGQRAVLRPELNNMELLLVCQCLVGFLQDERGRRGGDVC